MSVEHLTSTGPNSWALPFNDQLRLILDNGGDADAQEDYYVCFLGKAVAGPYLKDEADTIATAALDLVGNPRWRLCHAADGSSWSMVARETSTGAEGCIADSTNLLQLVTDWLDACS